MANVPRSSKAQAEEPKHISHKVADFLRKYRLYLLILLAVVVAAVLGVAFWTAINGATVKTSTASVEKVEADIAAYQGQQDQAKKADLEKSIETSLDRIIARWPHFFAGQRAHALKARLAEEKKDWAVAEKEWMAAVDALPKDYLAPVALQNAAVAAEERGAPDKSAEYYKRLLAGYPNAPAGIPHAYFALGRLAEDSKDYTSAMTDYEKIVTAYPEDDWTKLAKDRILFMKSRGLAK